MANYGDQDYDPSVDTDLSAVDITGATDIGADLADADEIGVYDASATANRKSALSRVWAYVRTKIFGTLGNAGRLLKSDGDGTASEGQIEDSVSGGVLDLVATITADRTLTLPDADLDLSQVTGGLAGADATLLTGTVSENAVPRVNADGDLVDGAAVDDGTTLTAINFRAQFGFYLENTKPLNSRNGANTAWLQMARVNVANRLYIGDDNTLADVTLGNAGGAVATKLQAYGSTNEGGRLYFEGAGAYTNGSYFSRYQNTLYYSYNGSSVVGIDGNGIDLISGKKLSVNGNDVIDTNRLINLRSYTVATLPSAGTLGRKAAASDGRKSGEGAGAGTGVEVMDDGSQWYCEDTSSAVAA